MGNDAPKAFDASDMSGFQAFYRAQLPVVYGYLLRLCGGDRHLAEDLVQEVFFELVGALRGGHPERADIRWLITVARNRFLDHWRREERALRTMPLLAPVERHDGPEPERNSVLDHVTALSADERIALMLRYVDGLRVGDIAQRLGRTTDATYSLLARARNSLRQRMTEVAS